MPAVESPEQTTDKPAATAEDGKPADKAVTDTATAPITPKEIVEQLQELKKTNEPLAKEIHKQVKYSLEAQRLIKELAPDAKTLAEAKELIANRVSPEIQETFDAVQATDQLLYTGGEAHKELVENILEDLKSTLGDEGPARFSELTSNMLSKMKDTDPAGYVQHQRTNFLDASEQSGLIESLNKLSGHLVAGRTAEAKALLGNVVKFFQAEIKADQDGAKARTDQQATQAKAASAAVESLRTETKKAVDSTTNKILGSYLAPFVQKDLKGLSRSELEKVAAQIYTDAHAELGKDADYVKNMSTKYPSMKTPFQQRALLKVYEEKLKSGFGQKVVENTVKRLYPDRFKTGASKPAATKAATPASAKVTIGGKEQTVFQLAKRPTNLVRSDVEVAGRLYTSKDLELLQAAKGIGLVLNKSGEGHSFVQWKR